MAQTKKKSSYQAAGVEYCTCNGLPSPSYRGKGNFGK